MNNSCKLMSKPLNPKLDNIGLYPRPDQGEYDKRQIEKHQQYMVGYSLNDFLSHHETY